jgi:hypothetical protein
MPMRPQLWSLSGLATELKVTLRTISQALATVPSDGKTELGHDGWRMLTALEALGATLAVRNHRLSKANGRGNGQGGDAYLASRTSLASERAQLLRLKR